MTTIHRLEAQNSAIGAVMYTFPSGVKRQASWKSEHKVTDTLSLAKECAAQVRNTLMEEGRQLDIDSTNWPSLVAGTQHHINDWNSKLSSPL